MLYLHRRGISSPNARWGWKNPRSLWLIPFLTARFPELKFIHMIRDARDMMLSENIYFLRQNGHWLLGPDWWKNPEAAQLELWRASNERALEFARHLGDRYHIVRYEDLCRKPADTVSAVMAFLGQPEINIGPLIEGIRDRGNIGRWRKDQAAKVVELSRAARADLARSAGRGNGPKRLEPISSVLGMRSENAWLAVCSEKACEQRYEHKLLADSTYRQPDNTCRPYHRFPCVLERPR